MASKVTHSENIADLYIMYKDHKEGDKTRPTATGHSSNSLGLSNAVSEVLEAVANAEQHRYNTISSEDMLARVNEYNLKVLDKNKKWEETRLRKLRCTKCKIMQYTDCPYTENHEWEYILSTTSSQSTTTTSTSPRPPRGSPSPGTSTSRQENNSQDKNEYSQEQQRVYSKAEELVQLNCCGTMILEGMRTDCIECGPKLENRQEYSVLGSDVKALFPSITSENTGKIIREKVENSRVQFEGFCWKKGLAYISMNKGLTTELEELEEILPTRKSGLTKELLMSAITTSWVPESKFEYKTREPTEQEQKKIIGRVVEIATRTLFENKVYKFANKVYKQETGGSIGDRWTGAAAELVMQNWAENYEKILTRSGLEVLLLAGYVDDGRQGTTVLPEGMRFCKTENKFKYSTEAAIDDIFKRELGESKNQRMARTCLEAMNSINPDLEFTVESQEDFQNEKLPTLDFAIWQDKLGVLNHTYFQKEMRTPYVVMSRSAMSTQQKLQILSNELTRRLYSVNLDKNPQAEQDKIINQMTQELRTSEYNHATAREIIISGIRGLRKRLELRKKKGQEKYRPGVSTVKIREHKKLLGRETWYKGELEQEYAEHEDKIINKPRRTSPKNKKVTREQKQEKHDKPVVSSVMFVPFTPGSELAKRLRENEEKMTKFSKHKIKIVERAGVQLQNLLTRSNPWKGHDCTRDNCLLCFTKNKTEKNMTQECHKRNIVYETRCLTCEQLEQDRIDQLEITEQEKTNKKKETKQYKYIGETSRSAFERGWEHMNDMAQLKSGSHMLKHVVDKHQEQDMAEIQFGMRILKHCKTSFERQVYESVIIQNERQEHFLLNSRSEFNRCSLPRLCTSVGEGEYKNYSKELEQEKQEEDRLEARIRALRKERNKARLHPTREPDNLKKRRKVENGNYIKIQELWGEPEQARPNKNKGEELHDRLNKKPREQSPRPARGSPSPGKTPRDEKDKNKQENEHRSYDGPTDWDNQIEKHTQEMYREQEKKEQEHQNEEQQKETCWELHNLCRDFLEENSKEWARLKEKRTNEKNRVLRLEQAGILSRKAKMKALENNVKLGLSKIPAKDRKEIEREQERVREQELRTVREDLWTLRGREKKVVENKTLKRIQELKKTTEQVVEILTRER